MSKKSRISLILIAVLALILSVPYCSAAAYADSSFATATIPARCKIANNIPGTHIFTYELRADSDSTRMPEEANGSVMKVAVTKSGKLDFGTIVFDHPEVYNYTIREVSNEFKYFKKDPQVYRVAVYADTDGKVFTIIRDKNGKKPDEILFKNTYNKPEPAKKKTAQTGDTIRYMIIGVIGFLCLIALAFVVPKRADTNGKERIKEFHC